MGILVAIIPEWIRKSVAFIKVQDLTEHIGEVRVRFILNDGVLFKAWIDLENSQKDLIEAARAHADGDSPLFSSTLKDWKGSVGEDKDGHYVAFKPPIKEKK